MTKTLVRVRARVSQRDIDKGTRNVCDRCPAAIAALRALPGAQFVNAHWNHMTAHYGVDAYTVATYRGRKPDGFDVSVWRPSIGRFIEAFDAGEKVAPFSFTLWVPPELARKPS